MRRRSLSLSAKLSFFLMAAALALLFTGASQFANTRSQMFALRTQEADAALRAIFTVLEAYHADVVAGDRTLEQAQRAVRAMLKAYRFADGEGYVGVLDDAHVVLIQPAHPETEGDDETDRRSHDGRYIAREAVAIGRAQGFGFNTYPYINPHSGAPDVKTSAIGRFEPWGWTLVAGVFQKRFDEAMRQIAFRSIAEFGSAMLVLIFFARIVVRRLVGPVFDLAQVAETMATGARVLSVPHIERGDEVGRIARALRRLEPATRGDASA